MTDQMLIMHLHSTMYLLKLKLSTTPLLPCILFTFHHVSIKTAVADMSETVYA